MEHDLAIVGSGGAAFAAAIAARRKGRSVVLVERGTIGGTCVNTGCVPSKALLAAAGARGTALEAGRFPGVRTGAGEVDVAELVGGTRELVERVRAEKYLGLAVEYGWDIVAGSARFAAGDGGPVLEVELAEGGTRRIEAAHYLVATGSTPWVPPIDGLAETGYLTSTTAMDRASLPTSMLVVGGGYVGLEQAQLFARLGVRVTVLEMADRLAPSEEPEAGAAIAGVFADEGIRVRTGVTLTRVRREGGRVVASVGEEELTADEVLVATGRRPATAGLGLAGVGVATGPLGEVPTDAHLRTSHPRIWAAGDVTGHPQFVYVAGAHGTLVADNALDGAGRVLDHAHLPRVTFTSPAIAGVGLTEAAAERRGWNHECRVLPLEHVPRALVNRDTRGLVKIVAERDSGRLLGVTVVSESAGEVIAAAVYALRAGMTVDQLAGTWSPYLTMTEALKLAAQTFHHDVALLSCCAS